MLIFKLFTATVFLFVLSFIMPAKAYAGNQGGVITSVFVDSNFSDPGCGNSTDAQPRNPSVNWTWRTFTFNAPAGLPVGAHCQAKACGKGQTDRGNISGSGAANTSIVSGFNSRAEPGPNGDANDYCTTYDIYITAPACTPSTQNQTIACPAPATTGTMNQTRTSSCPGPSWPGWTTTSSNCCTPTFQQQGVGCPAPQTGTQMQQRDYTCPAASYGGWYNIAAGTTCVAPTLTLSASPATGYAPNVVRLSWNSANHAAGTTCTASWNSFLSVPATSSGYDDRTLGANNYNFTINCSDGTSAAAAFSVSALPSPGISVNRNDCTSSTANVGLHLTAPNIGQNVTVNVLKDSTLVYSVLLGPGQQYDITNANFNDPYKPLTPNTYSTFSATTSYPGKYDSPATAVGVTTLNCPSPPNVNSIAPFCSGNMPYINLDYVNSTYGSPSSYYVDRVPAGNVSPIASGTHPYQDPNILNNTAYSYSMRANNAIGTSASSNSLAATSPNCTPPTVTVPTNTCSGGNPSVALNVTSPGNAGQNVNTWTDLVSINGVSTPANLAFSNIAPGATVNYPNSGFSSGYSTLQSLTTYVVKGRSNYNTWSPDGVASFTTLECNGPKPFTLSLNTAAAAVCTATDGLPKVNLTFGKSANADLYDIYVRSADGAGNYTVPVSTELNVPSNTLFPGVPIASAVGTGTRTYTVNPAISYGVYMVAKKSSTGSWIYSNWSTMNTATPVIPGETPWVFTNPGWCDTYPPQITLMNLMQDCYQPDTWTTSQPMRTLVRDDPRPGAPANSVAGIRDVTYSLDPQGSTNWSYPATSVGSNYYDRTFTPANFTSGSNRYYSLGARGCDNNSNCANITKKDFLYTNICTGWIQTHGGNVHTEGNLNTPGGPQ